jgi:hypothetical protein
MDERAPLLQFPNGSVAGGDLGDHHSQFCQLVGMRPINHPDGEPHRPHPRSLYARAVKRRSTQSCTYMFTTALINTLLLTQIVLGAALTGLGASNSSRILITVFGALNTIIAGVIAFLKSRGQPMRARVFRDDLSRVVDEIENSAVMWYGISCSAHGYDAIDTDEQVTVRSEVARLTRLFDKAVKMNTMNDPDLYSGGSAGDNYSATAGLRKPAQPPPGPNGAPAATPNNPYAFIPEPAPPAPAVPDPDASPASKAPEPPKAAEPSPPETPAPEDPKPAEPADDKKDSSAGADAPEAKKPEEDKPAADAPPEGKGKEPAAAPKDPEPDPAPTPAPTPSINHDPDASPASAAHPPKKEDSSQSSKTLVDNGKP